MKAKKLDKKLTLNKSTVSNLSGPEMQHIMGGDTAKSDCSNCFSCVPTAGGNPNTAC